MIRNKGILIIVLIMITTIVGVQAQQPPANKDDMMRRLGAQNPPGEKAIPSGNFYRLDFVIQGRDKEKPVAARYSLWVQSGIPGKMIAGSEVPYPSDAFSSAGSGATKNISYRSIGISIDCMMTEVNDNPQLNVNLNISDTLPSEKDSDPPVFRKTTLNSNLRITLGKTMTVGIIEDHVSRQQFQVDVTATKLN
jgi:hypothetical protein